MAVGQRLVAVDNSQPAVDTYVDDDDDEGGDEDGVKCRGPFEFA